MSPETAEGLKVLSFNPFRHECIHPLCVSLLSRTSLLPFLTQYLFVGTICIIVISNGKLYEYSFFTCLENKFSLLK